MGCESDMLALACENNWFVLGNTENQESVN